MAVFVHRVNHGGRRRRARPVGVETMSPLPTVPAIVGASYPLVNFLVSTLPDIIDVEARGAGVRIHREAKWVTQSPRKRLLAVLANGGAARDVAASCATRHKRIARGNCPVAGHAQNFSGQHVFVARGIIAARRSRADAAVVGAAITNADVKQSVFAEMHVAAIVIAAARGHAINEHHLGGRVDYVGVGTDSSGSQNESRHPVDAAIQCRVAAINEGVRRVGSGVVRCGTIAAVTGGVEDVHKLINAERRIHRNAEHAHFAACANFWIDAARSGVKAQRRDQRQSAAFEYAQRTVLTGNQHSAIRRERDSGRRAHGGHQGVRKAQRQRLRINAIRK